MTEFNKDIIKDLCEGLSDEMQAIVKAAYWQGCLEGMAAANDKKHKVSHQEDNVVFLKTLDS